MNDVDVFVSWGPTLIDVDLHLGEIETVVPMNSVRVPRDHWDSPRVLGISIRPKIYYRIGALILNISLESRIIHPTDNALVEFEDFHREQIEDVRLIVVEYDPPHLDRRVTNQAIIHTRLQLAPRLVIVLPVGSGPGLGTEARQCSVQVVEDFSPWLLISNLNED